MKLRLILAAISFLFVSSLFATAQGMSTICKFNAGPRTGQTHDYAPMAAIPVGSPCQDGQGSTGVVIAGGGGGGTMGGGDAKAAMVGGAAAPSFAGTLTQFLCKLTSGPKAGQLPSYLSWVPLAVGSVCHDALGNTGVVVARATSPQ